MGSDSFLAAQNFPGVPVNMITKQASSPGRIQECDFDSTISTLSRRGKKWNERDQPGPCLIRKGVETNIRTYKRQSL